jgi:hypothetical protein
MNVVMTIRGNESAWSCTQATIDVSTGLHPAPSHRSKSTLGTHPESDMLESDMFTDEFRAYASAHSNTVPKIKVPVNVRDATVHLTVATVIVTCLATIRIHRCIQHFR